jgi:hypothetical protein
VTHIEADAVTLPESALLVHPKHIFSGKTLMDCVISLNENKIIIVLARSTRPSKYT